MAQGRAPAQSPAALHGSASGTLEPPRAADSQSSGVARVGVPRPPRSQAAGQAALPRTFRRQSYARLPAPPPGGVDVCCCPALYIAPTHPPRVTRQPPNTM